MLSDTRTVALDFDPETHCPGQSLKCGAFSVKRTWGFAPTFQIFRANERIFVGQIVCKRAAPPTYWYDVHFNEGSLNIPPREIETLLAVMLSRSFTAKTARDVHLMRACGVSVSVHTLL